ncbi:hypothetical protein HanRHA438_Chr07g0320881 [Helianthus annuus]|uniref:Uncharacterized protein n=1 Tax=Helianthus annuus TaxID=4232 RepID=A0A9K3IPJ6_HELAN|nr:hypothetical protein HanXRQr2_Chr07g0311761 [Helianthus annuus]KAJ0551438.1 hypothetical protein HanHA300_Chr07g0257141 [Helianthus annuus]KAJ0564397.1 hypothetical protein HanHA89_Chr07g0273861 [Helianthus annuus]KAJ0729724.1 hypothetical protein HanLR1_Chr07g0256151 [Helianthus annuus]KAJ0906097.1 hypothetical protein HanPSC8_Chr07g0301641 [Helianthus annuus]
MWLEFTRLVPAKIELTFDLFNFYYNIKRLNCKFCLLSSFFQTVSFVFKIDKFVLYVLKSYMNYLLGLT